jgi:polysulfide reductase chain C
MTEKVERQVYWRWEIAFYLFFAGTGAGAYLIAVLNDLFGQAAPSVSRNGVLWGTALVLIGIPFLIVDLGRKGRFLRAGINPRHAWIGRGFYILSFFVLLGLIHIGLWIWPFRVLEAERSFRMVLSILSGTLALAVAVYTGLLLKSMKSIHFWDTPLIVILFVLSALSTGVVCLLFFSGNPLAGDENGAVLRFLNKADLVLIVLEALILMFYIVTMSGATEASGKSVASLLVGDLRLLFWGGVIGCGLVFPVFLKAFEISGSGMEWPGLVSVSSAMIWAGGLFLRYCILAAGVQVSALLPSCR